MKFAVQQDEWAHDDYVIRKSEFGGRLIDAWISDQPQDGKARTEGIFSLIEKREGLTGTIALPIEKGDAGQLAIETSRVYREMFALLRRYPDMRLLRIWNYIPDINLDTPGYGELTEMYHHFNSGRENAYKAHFGMAHAQWPLPAATAVGTCDGHLTIEFFAVPASPVFLENAAQIPAKNYSAKFGPTPPLFVRGAVLEGHDHRLLISSGTAAIKGEESLHRHDPKAQFHSALDNLRVLASRFNLHRHGLAFDFGLEDIKLLRVYYRRAEDRELLEVEARQTMDRDCKLVMMAADLCRRELLVELEATFYRQAK